MSTNQWFYKELKKHQTDLVDLLANDQLFHAVPKDWYIVLVDIENSTQAVKNNKHQDVNLSATGSIVTVLNEIKKTDKKMRIPYFFGGDGTTFIVPQSILKSVLSVLENYRHHIKQLTSLTLKVGAYPVSEIYSTNRKIRIAKLALNPYLTIPVVLGTGLKHAEGIIKASFVDVQRKSAELEPVNLEGMECRWKEIEPPGEVEKINCLLAYCEDDNLQAEVYGVVMEKITNVFGNFEKRQPISIPKLKLDTSLNKIKTEMNVKVGKYKFLTLMKLWFYTLAGRFYFKWSKEGKSYLEKISQLSHTLMLDGMINTIISGKQSQVDEFVAFMDELEEEGKIIYGLHTTHASIMSCYVEDRDTNHNHFVDGTEGGFTKAAMMYKAKIR